MYTDIEKEYVIDTYEKISQTFNKTRSYLWPSVKQFLDDIPSYSLIVEIGCGNGKNLLYRKKNCFNIGMDICDSFTKMCYNKKIEVNKSSCLYIPMQDNKADFVLSIAVIHHLSSDKRRKDAILELIRILKVGGKMMIQVWAMKQHKKSRNKFTKSDNLVLFQNSTKSLSEQRFYHIFKENEFNNLIKDIKNIKIIKEKWEKGNWIYILEKI